FWAHIWAPKTPILGWPTRGLVAADDQIVAVHHFRPSRKAEDRVDIGRRTAAYPLRILRVIGAQPAADFDAVGATEDPGSAAGKFAVDPHHPDRQEAVAASKRSDRAGVDGERPFGFERAGDPFFPCRHRIAGREKPRASRAVFNGAKRMLDAARRDHH